MEGGALLVSGSRIAAVGRARELAGRWPEAERIDLDGCALLPALVNAHCHLELSALGDPPRETGFVPWLLEVIRRKRAASGQDWERSLAEGVRECAETGQGTVADILSIREGAAYPSDGPDVLAFAEVIAPRPSRARGVVKGAVAARTRGGVRLAGLSPHSPYTACAEAYLACAREAEVRGWRLVTHVAETAGEVSFCLDEEEDLTPLLYSPLSMGPPPRPGAHPVKWLDRLGLLGPRTVLVHAVHLGPSEVATVGRSGAAVVLCPRSNRRFGSFRAPGRALLEAGVPVGLGTDSRLSAGDLDLRRDAAAAVEDYGWSPAEALWAATRGSARVLGLADRGALVAGARADILAVRVGAGLDPWEQVLAGEAVEALWIRGERWESRAPWPDKAGARPVRE
ncbi:MAG: amidohydrolase family protein [Deferrisomatales bacterium]|nr:amidohydrolase family protein [Deferrisomatales bacterium]